MLRIASATLGAFLIDAARVAKRRTAGVKVIEGVQVFNHDKAFDDSRWGDMYLEGDRLQKSANQEHWLVMMKTGTTDEQLDAACAAHAQCELHGDASGVPFLELTASAEELTDFLREEGSQIAFVEPNLPMSATPELPAVQSDTPWGLRRVRSRSLSSMPAEDVGPANGGAGVHAYVLDTGIRTTHEDFGDRAVPTVQVNYMFFLKECKGDATCALDNQGHGTHCSGTIGGTSYGVAKGSTLHAVKVLGDSGAGSTIGITNSINWVGKNAEKPALASMSLGGGFSQALNDAIDKLVGNGVTVVTASGNENTDACTKSPGSAPLNINVGSTDPNDKRSSFSNWGTCVDLFAPGRDILSAVHTSDTASKKYSGTSMACPHVSGAVAMLLASNGDLTPAQVKSRILGSATPDVVSNANTGSPNLLLFSAA